MIEDKSFNAFLKAKLEEGVEVPDLRLVSVGAAEPGAQVSPRHAWWPWAVLKVAAAVAVLCGVFAWRTVQSCESRRELQVTLAIELLEECHALAAGDVVPESEGSTSIAEKLLAWQDAPYSEVANAQEAGESLSAEGAGEGEAPNSSGA